MKPSEFAQLQNLSLKQRYSLPSGHKNKIIQHVNPSERNRDFSVALDDPIFRPTPSKVHYQNYDAFTTYETIITFRNMDKMTRKMRLEPLAGTTFEICSFKDDANLAAKVAAGMEVSFKLKFTPKKDEDYHSELICVTEREKFIIPIEALGTRAVLDIPDVIYFEKSSVNYENSKIVLVQNTGNRTSKIRLSVDSPFSVQPDEVTLAPMQNMQIEIVFTPKEVKLFESFLKIRLDSGETLHSKLVGSPVEQDISLEYDEFHMKPAFISMFSENRIRILNNSNVMIMFKWKYFKNEEEEVRYRENRKATVLNARKSQGDLLEDEKRVLKALDIIDRSLLLFEDEVFFFEPLQGIVWPNSYTEVQVMFKPDCVGVHSNTVYCDVTGRCQRLPLNLIGEASGPQAQLSFDTLDISEVFINHQHNYEVTLENIGQIDLCYNLLETNSLFHSKFRFHPSSGKIAVGKKQLVSIEFCSDMLGSFSEEFLFELAKSPDPLVLHIKGTVIGPKFNFDVSEVDYGIIPIGFPVTKQLSLVNISQISMNYSLRIEAEDAELIQCFIIPQGSDSLKPLECTQFDIEYTPVVTGLQAASLVVDIGSLGKKVFSLPIRAKVVSPKIGTSCQKIDLETIVINESYTCDFYIINDTYLPLIFNMMQPSMTENSYYQWSCDLYEEVIPAQSKIPVTIDFVPKKTGLLDLPIRIYSLGNPDAVVVSIVAKVEGPSINLSESRMDWSKIQVLSPHRKVLTIKNESPVDATFEAKWMKKSDVFAVNIEKSTIKSNSSIQLEITAYLDDSILFEDELRLLFVEEVTKSVFVSARGVGSTIVCEGMEENFDFGPLLCRTSNLKDWKIVNKGRRHQQISWIYTGKITNLKERRFLIMNPRFSLKPGESHNLNLVAKSANHGKWEETFCCYSLFEATSVKKEVITLSISANFVEPMVSLPINSLEFDVICDDAGSVHDSMKQLTVKNVTRLPIEGFVKCPLPFSTPSNGKIRFEKDEAKVLDIYFHPSYYNSHESLTDSKKLIILLEDSVKKHEVDMTAQVSYPTLKFDATSFDFDKVESKIFHVQVLKAKNNGRVDAKYSWHIENIANIDITPWTGLLSPGEEETFFITYTGAHQEKLCTNLVCKIFGGCEKKIKICAEFYDLSYTASLDSIDYGEIPFNAVAEKTLLIQNQGKLPFLFKKTDDCAHSGVAFFPERSTIQPNATLEVTISFCPKKIGMQKETVIYQLGTQRLCSLHLQATGTAIIPDINLPKKILTFGSISRSSKVQDALKGLSSFVYNDFHTYELFEDNLDLIDVLNEKISYHTITLEKTGLNDSDTKHKLKIMKHLADVSAWDYILDFGLINVNEKFFKSFEIPNLKVSDLKLCSENIDKRISAEMKEENARTIVIIAFEGKDSVKFEEVLEYSVLSGPRLRIKILANVVVPNVECSADEISFGEVFCGHRKKQSFSVFNHSDLDLKWLIAIQGKKPSRFSIEPKDGIAISGKEVILQASYEPSSMEKESVTFKISIGGVNLPLKLNGKGVQAEIDIFPARFDLSNVNPHSEIIENKITITNVNSFPIEIFFPDFDRQHIEEVEMMQSLFENTSTYIPIRWPGQSLINLMDLCPKVLSENDDISIAPKGDPISSSSFIEQPLFIIVHGPPMSGKTTLSKQLAIHLNLPLISFVKESCSDATSIERYLALIENKLRSCEYRNGVIIDGLNSQVSIVKSMNSLLKAIGPQGLCYTFILEADNDILKSRLVTYQDSEKVIMEEISRYLCSIDEVAYCTLKPDEQKLFDSAVHTLNNHRTELKTKTKIFFKSCDERSLRKSKNEKLQRKRGKPLGRPASSPLRLEKSVDTEKLENYDEHSESPELHETKDENSYCMQQLLAALQEVKMNVSKSSLGLNNGKKKPVRNVAPAPGSSELVISQMYDFGKDLLENGPSLFVFDVNGDFTPIQLFHACKEKLPGYTGSLNETADEKNIDAPHHNISTTEQLFFDGRSNQNLENVLIEIDEDSSASVDVSRASVTKKSVRDLKSTETTCRAVVNPSDKKSFTLKLKPQGQGTYMYSLNVASSGYGLKKEIPLTVECCYPTIKLISVKKGAKSYPVEDGGACLHFGQVSVSRKDKNKKSDRNLFKIELLNTSNNLVKVASTIVKDFKCEIFSVEPSSFEINGNSTISINIDINPKTSGDFLDDLLFLVKDNPKVLKITVKCQIIMPSIELTPSNLHIEKVMLNRSAKKSLDIKNKTAIKLYWRIINDTSEEITLSSKNGMLKPGANLKVEVSFCSSKPMVFKKQFKIEYCEFKDFNEDIMMDFFTVSAEAFDVLLDLHLPRNSSNGIDFGLLRINEEVKQVCTLKNKGKYEFGYKIILKEGLDCITMNPCSGIISPSDKQITLTVTFKSNVEITLMDEQAIKLLVLDPVSSEVVGTLPVKISVRVEYSKFQLLNQKDLSFGPVQIGTKQLRQLSLFNDGSFDLSFFIVPANHENKSLLSSKVKVESKVAKKEKVDMAQLKYFSITPGSGAIQPGSKMLLTVELKTDCTGTFEDIFEIETQDHNQNTSYLTSYTLRGEVCVPQICTHIESMFNLHGFSSDSPKPMTFFIPGNYFFFGAILPHSSKSAALVIQNISKLFTEAHLSFKSKKTSIKGEIADSTFELVEKVVELNPFERKVITLTFSPPSVGIFRQGLDVHVNATQENISFDICGEGQLPKLSLGSRISRLDNKPIVRFTCSKANLVSRKAITIRNEADVDAHVMLELNSKHSTFEVNDNVSEVFLKSHDYVVIPVSFKSSGADCAEGVLVAYSKGNSNDKIQVKLVGNTQDSNIEIIGLESDLEELIFNGTPVGESTSKTVQIRNNSDDVMRVAWNRCSDITVVPSLCHINPKDLRKVLITFFPKQPVDIQTKLSFKLTRISHPVPPILNWEENATINLEEKTRPSKKSFEFLGEPPYDTIENLHEGNIYLNLKSDYVFYQCSTSDILLPLTFIKERKSTTFSLKNTGKSNLRFSSIINGDIAKEFELIPSSGLIVPGEAHDIVVLFSPQIAGEKECQVVFEMASLAPNLIPLVINVKSAARRSLFVLRSDDLEFSNDVTSIIQIEDYSINPCPKIFVKESKGAKSKCCFDISFENTSSQKLSFVWLTSDSQFLKQPVPKFVVLPGETVCDSFQVLPGSPGEHIYQKTLKIVEKGIHVPFLFKVVIKDISVNLYSPMLLMGEGKKDDEKSSQFKLVNDERFAILFTVIQPKEISHIRIEPTSGSVPGNSELTLTAKYRYIHEDPKDDKILIKIKNKFKPLELIISGSCLKSESD